MPSIDRLKKTTTVEMALIVLQPDAKEALPSTDLGDEDPIDISILDKDSDVRRRFEMSLQAGNTSRSLWGDWQRKVAGPAENILVSEQNSVNPHLVTREELEEIHGDNEKALRDDIFYLKIGVEILKRFNGEEVTSEIVPGINPMPPGLKTATTLGVALLMFQPDNEEGIPFGKIENPNFSILSKQNPTREKFEQAIAGSKIIDDAWGKKVIRIFDYLTQGNASNSAPLITHDGVSTKYRSLGSKEAQVAETYLQIGREILERLETDERPWLDRTPLKIMSHKQVLGKDEANDLFSIPALWFAHFVQNHKDVREAMGEDWYKYVINGGFRRNDQVFYQDLAEIAGVDGELKGFLTRFVYGLDDVRRKIIASALKDLQEKTVFSEYQFHKADQSYDIQFYLDPTSSFVEIQINAGEGPTIIRSDTSSENNTLEKLIVSNPGNIPLDTLKQIIWSLRFSLPETLENNHKAQVLKVLKEAIAI